MNNKIPAWFTEYNEPIHTVNILISFLDGKSAQTIFRLEQIAIKIVKINFIFFILITIATGGNYINSLKFLIKSWNIVLFQISSI